VLDMRDKVLKMYGVTPQPRITAPSAAMQANASAFGYQTPPAPVAETGSIDWKSKLCGLIGKREKRTPQKGDFVYTVTEEGGGYVGSISSEMFKTNYTGEPSQSKRLAEHAAAMAAIQTEFPAEAAQFLAVSGGVAAPPKQQAGQKRSHAEMQTGPGDAKSQFMHAAQMLLGRSVTKADVVFETKAVNESETEFASTLCFKAYDPATTYQGQPSDGKKAAESSASTMCLEALASHIAAATEEHQAKKAKQRAEKAKEMKEKETAKKAAKAESA